MNNIEFKNFILETASKYFKTDSNEKKSKIVKEQETIYNVSADQVKILAEDMKKINKKIDLRNPLINPEFFDKINESIENNKKKIIKEDKRYLKEKKPLNNKEQKERWQNLLNYNIPQDEDR